MCYCAHILRLSSQIIIKKDPCVIRKGFTFKEDVQGVLLKTHEKVVFILKGTFNTFNFRPQSSTCSSSSRGSNYGKVGIDLGLGVGFTESTQ